MGDQAARLSEDITAAQWIVARLASESYQVDMLLPEGFAAYLRLLHPIVAHTKTGEELIPWRELAARAGLTDLDRRVQFGTLASYAGVDASDAPLPGELPDEQLAALADVLADHTRSAHRCWFCIWEGYGPPADAAPDFSRDRHGLFARHAEPHPRPGTRAPEADAERGAIVEASLGRRYRLYTGPLAAVTTLGLPAGLWWPDDHTWCVATDVDLDSTYIGGSETLARALTRHPNLEVLPARLRDSITQDADRPPRAPPHLPPGAK
jgi:hypothetical protein